MSLCRFYCTYIKKANILISEQSDNYKVFYSNIQATLNTIYLYLNCNTKETYNDRPIHNTYYSGYGNFYSTIKRNVIGY